MSESATQPMMLGVTYWPRQAGYRWWSSFDRGAVREELAHIRALGMDSVRFFLRWEDVQPSPRRIRSETLRAFEVALDLAGDAGLRVVAALFPVALGGALHLPRWVSHPDPLGELQQVVRFGMPLVVAGGAQPPLVYDDGYHPNDAPDLFRDATLHDAERYLISEVVGYFGSHGALWGWQLGEGLELVRRPDSAAAVREWYGRMAEAVRAHRNGARVLGVTTERGLTTATGPRPEHLAEACDLAAIALDTPLRLPGARPLDVDTVVFAHALASGLAARPLAVTGLGLPSEFAGQLGWVADTSYGRPVQTYLAHPHEQAEFVGGALERLHAAGAPAVWLAAYADHPAEQWRSPPLDRQMRPRALGLVDAAGREKPLAAAVQAFAARGQGAGGREQEAGARSQEAEQREQTQADEQAPTPDRQPLPPDPRPLVPLLDVDPERYWRDPRRECERLWKER